MNPQRIQKDVSFNLKTLPNNIFESKDVHGLITIAMNLSLLHVPVSLNTCEVFYSNNKSRENVINLYPRCYMQPIFNN